MANFDDDYLRRVDAGKVPNAEIVYKFGRLKNITNTYTPVTGQGVYQMPTTAASLEVVSDSAQDNPAGTGAINVEIKGLGADWRPLAVTYNLNGTTPVTITERFTRVFNMKVVSSNTYATASTSSHAGTITLREQGTLIPWAACEIEGGLGVGVCLGAFFTIPKGYTGHLIAEQIIGAASKEIDIIMVGRGEADKVIAPYSSFYWGEVHYSNSGEHNSAPKGIGEEMVGPYDIGFMAKAASANANLGINFELLLIKNY